MSSGNPYQILHLDEDASYEEIKERYRHLTRYLHPDKQPLENYATTKRLFEQIDEAYKSIASPLRRFLFREYGLYALKILEDMSGEFKEFDGQNLSTQQIKRLRQLMVYCLYEREAGVEMDRSKFSSKYLLNLSKVLRKQSPGKGPSKLNRSFPEVENSSFEYEMVLPDVYGFSNSLALSQTGQNLRADPRYSLAIAFSSVRRFFGNYLLIAQCTLSSEQTSTEISIDRICENNLHLKFTPVSLTNLTLSRPKFSVQKSYGHSQFSAITDLASSSFQFSDYTNSKVGRTLRLFIEPGSVGLVPKVEWQMAANLRFFIQLTSSFNFAGEGSINIQQSFNYGYKLALADDLKLELTSSIGYPNYFQIAIINSKFRAAIPFATSEGSVAEFQLGKISVMLLTYLCYQSYHWLQKKNRVLREKLIKQQQNRFNEQRRELQRQLSYVEISASGKRQKEVRLNGLIVLRAFLGQNSQVMDIRQKMALVQLPKDKALAQTVAEVEESIHSLRLVESDFAEQLCDVTLLIQNEVSGGQIIAYELSQLQQFNPALSDSTQPWILLAYLQRGAFKVSAIECKGELWLGGPGEQKTGDFLRKGWRKLKKFLIDSDI